jgi:hypothetical protein
MHESLRNTDSGNSSGLPLMNTDSRDLSGLPLWEAIPRAQPAQPAQRAQSAVPGGGLSVPIAQAMARDPLLGAQEVTSPVVDVDVNFILWVLASLDTDMPKQKIGKLPQGTIEAMQLLIGVCNKSGGQSAQADILGSILAKDVQIKNNHSRCFPDALLDLLFLCPRGRRRHRGSDLFFQHHPRSHMGGGEASTNGWNELIKLFECCYQCDMDICKGMESCGEEAGQAVVAFFIFVGGCIVAVFEAIAKAAKAIKYEEYAHVSFLLFSALVALRFSARFFDDLKRAVSGRLKKEHARDMFLQIAPISMGYALGYGGLVPDLAGFQQTVLAWSVALACLLRSNEVRCQGPVNRDKVRQKRNEERFGVSYEQELGSEAVIGVLLGQEDLNGLLGIMAALQWLTVERHEAQQALLEQSCLLRVVRILTGVNGRPMLWLFSRSLDDTMRQALEKYDVIKGYEKDMRALDKFEDALNKAPDILDLLSQPPTVVDRGLWEPTELNV